MCERMYLRRDEFDFGVPPDAVCPDTLPDNGHLLTEIH